MSQRAVFLDRDGTVLEHYDYLTDESQVQLLGGAGAALRRLSDRGYLLVVVTNQSAVGRGMVTEQKLSAIHDRMKSQLAEQGVYLKGIYYCPYHPEAAIPKYRRESELRKPAAGMLRLAAKELDIDLGQSWMVGDDDRDIEAGQAAGCRTIMLETRGSTLVQRGQARADYLAVNLQEAANMIVRYGSEVFAETATTTALPPREADNAEGAPAATEGLPEHEPTGRDVDINVGQTTGKDNYESPPMDEQHERAKAPTGKTLLNEILREVKSINRQQGYHEFSVAKLLAGIVQMLVFLCLILAYRYSCVPEDRSEAVQNCLLLALTFQTMTLTLMMMHRSH